MEAFNGHVAVEVANSTAVDLIDDILSKDDSGFEKKEIEPRERHSVIGGIVAIVGYISDLRKFIKSLVKVFDDNKDSGPIIVVFNVGSNNTASVTIATKAEIEPKITEALQRAGEGSGNQ